MTTNDPAWLPAPQEQLGAVEAADVLKRLQDSALGLLGGLDRPPRSLRIKVNGVEIELEWPEPVAPAATAAAPVAAVPDAAGVAPVLRVEPAPAADTGHFISAHMVGVFYRCPEPGARPFVEPGDVVTPGQQVGIIEAMKLMIPVEADAPGRIVDVLAADGSSVEYGDRLFAFEPVDG